MKPTKEEIENIFKQIGPLLNQRQLEGFMDLRDFALASLSSQPSRDDHKTMLEAWQSVFGTTQLTHAKDRLDAAEKEVERLKRQPSREAEILAAVEAEPELPGAMPPHFREQFEKLPLDEALRIVVALTKSGIRNRVKALLKTPALPDESVGKAVQALKEAQADIEELREKMLPEQELKMMSKAYFVRKNIESALALLTSQEP